MPSVCAVVAMFGAAPVAAQVDPLLFLKNANAFAAVDARPNVLLLLDVSARMQRDAPADPARPAATSAYFDPWVYRRTGAEWEARIGVSDASAAASYRRRYRGLASAPAESGDMAEAASIETVGDRLSDYGRFEAPTRLSIARAAIEQAVRENAAVVRFGLIRMRQSNAAPALPSDAGVVAVADRAQAAPTDSGGDRWRIARATVDLANSASSISGVLVPPDAPGANDDLLAIVGRDARSPGALIAAGLEPGGAVDAPLAQLLDDGRGEALRLMSGDAACRNTIAVLITGGGEGTTSAPASPAAAARAYVRVGAGHRVPLYVVALAPPSADLASLAEIASAGGGRLFIVAKAEIDRALEYGHAGRPTGTVVVPEVVAAINLAASHAFAAPADVDAVPAAGGVGPLTEYPVASAVVGTVDLSGARDAQGRALPNTVVRNAAGTIIPQRSNVMITTAVALPGLAARLRASRVYAPMADPGARTGYRFSADGTRLWTACAPGPGCAVADSSRRNLFTATADGTIVPFTTGNAQILAPLMHLSVAEAATVIAVARNLPIGPILDSIPAFLGAPAADPPPDEDYPAFAAALKSRRTLVWVGTNAGLLEALDARTGVEVWGFVPMNLLPKLRTLADGQPVGAFDCFVDASPKIADVKIGGAWRTELIVGEGAGGTFYQAFDVTLRDLPAAAPADADALDPLLAFFADPARIPLAWTFPRYASFDPAVAPFGDLAAGAPAIEKSVGQSWSTPAIARVGSAAGPFAAIVGSGFLPYSAEQQPHRGGVAAGTTLYVLDMAAGAVVASRRVGNDGVAERSDNCADLSRVPDGCRAMKNALQSDPVAIGPDPRFVTTTYVGDLDGSLWRMDLSIDAGGRAAIGAVSQRYAGGAAQPIVGGLAAVQSGAGATYVFFATGSDRLPGTGADTVYHLRGLLDGAVPGQATFDFPLTKTADLAADERATAVPAVAGDVVFFTTSMLKPARPCDAPDTRLYAFTFAGGPAYDTSGDGRVSKSADTPLVRTFAGRRATAPFAADRHLVVAGADTVAIFGDPQQYNADVGQAGMRILSWREVR